MIASLKNFKLDENQKNLLWHVEPWWDKDLQKLINQQRKWLRRFGQQVDNFFPQTQYSYDQYPLLMKNATAFFSFYETKIKAILKIPRAVTKFRRWYLQVENFRALLMGIMGISQFYEALEKEAIPNKREFLIRESNCNLEKIYQNYCHEMQRLLPTETQETLEQIFKNTPLIVDKTLFNPVLVFNLMRKYLVSLAKAKKINEEISVNLIFKTVSTAICFEDYLKFQKKLLTNFI